MQILNKHKHGTPVDATYIGRGSVFGNPKVIGKDGTRAEVIEWYRTYLADKIIQRDSEIIKALKHLHDRSKLLCFCSPASCHGEVIKEYWEFLDSFGDLETAFVEFTKKYGKIQTTDISDYKAWIIDKLISRDPKITQDFKALELSQDLIPDNYRHLKAIPEKVLIPLHTSLIESGDYDKAVNLLADMNGKMVSYIPIADGITHINVYSKGKTKLGRALTNFSNLGFVHPEHGKFASVEGFWYWLGTGKIHDQLRVLYGYEAKEVGKKLPKVDVCNFEQEIKAAIFYKVEQNPGLWNALKESELPFSHYYFYGTPLNCKIIANDDAKWFIDYLELVRLHTKGLAKKVIIAGSRSIVEESIVAQALAESKFNPALIVSGGARGVDRLGEDVALKLGLPVRRFIPDWDGLGKKAGMVRNADMGNYADALVACWDNVSSGTKGMIDHMKRINKPSFVKTV